MADVCFGSSQYGIHVASVSRDVAVAWLDEDALCRGPAVITESGAVIVSSGPKTGRRPRDRGIVEHPDRAGDVWWGAGNAPISDAAMLAAKMQRHEANVWRINSEWTGGNYGVGRRMEVAHTRARRDTIHSSALLAVEYVAEPRFGLQIPTACPGGSTALRMPRVTWADPAHDDAMADEPANNCRKNFAQFADQTAPEVVAAEPR